jgi:hypothetical protein
VNERQVAAAGMLGRGRSAKHTAETLAVAPRTIERWLADLPGFREEVERVRANSDRPDPAGVFLDALSARRDDGVDWNARLRAAQELLDRDLLDGSAHDGPRIEVVVPATSDSPG